MLKPGLSIILESYLELRLRQFRCKIYTDLHISGNIETINIKRDYVTFSRSESSVSPVSTELPKKLGPFQTPLHSCAEPNKRIKYGSRAAFESVWFGSLGLERQTTLSSVGSAALCDSGAAADSYGALLMRPT